MTILFALMGTVLIGACAYGAWTKGELKEFLKDLSEIKALMGIVGGLPYGIGILLVLMNTDIPETNLGAFCMFVTPGIILLASMIIAEKRLNYKQALVYGIIGATITVFGTTSLILYLTKDLW